APLGTIIPLNVSASGKVLVTFMKEEQRKKFIESSPFVHKTEKSIIDKDAFNIELNKVRELGYAEDDEEYSKGVGCLAAPVYNHAKECIASIGITGSINNYHDNEKYQKYIQLTINASQKVSSLLGYNL
ncbi:MAG: IclR family transcriptional regulator, partial [Clostridiales bacterium]|nr:IclR family transcriptional regulator [Clostridiales bacterium]